MSVTELVARMSVVMVRMDLLQDEHADATCVLCGRRLAQHALAWPHVVVSRHGAALDCAGFRARRPETRVGGGR